MDYQDRTWTNEEVAALIGRDPKNLNVWAQRGWIYPSKEDAPGRGKPRTFDFAGVAHVMLTSELSKRGFSIGGAAYCSREWCYRPRIPEGGVPREVKLEDFDKFCIPPMTPFEGERAYLLTFHGEGEEEGDGGIFAANVYPYSAVFCEEQDTPRGYVPVQRALKKGDRVGIFDLTAFMERLDEALKQQEE